MSKSRKRRKKTKTPSAQDRIKALDKGIAQGLEHLHEVRGAMCFPFLGVNTTNSVVDDVFGELRTNFKDCDGHLDVIVDSGGGAIDAAYNLAMLFRKYGTEELNFIIPRWAKSAATLLVCSGDKIMMTPVAELGPLDPQITYVNPLEKRVEQISPLHIELTLDLIRQEFKKGSKDLAKGLLERLQFPLTIGGFLKVHQIGEQYLVKLLETRMLSGSSKPKLKNIANRLTSGYADHGYCINVDEAKSLGLKAVDLPEEQVDILWKIHGLNKEKQMIQREMRKGTIMDRIKELPTDILDKLQEEMDRSIREADIGE